MPNPSDPMTATFEGQQRAANFCVFENDGEMDSRLISTFGVNVKENDNAIGFFGTGLKYALAILLRNEHRVIIQTGAHTHKFGVCPTEIRGKSFDFVSMDGAPLGFTTDIGKTWKMWMAYRELFCNCVDEHGTVYETSEIPPPKAGKTCVIVEGDEFMAIRREHHRYFLISAPILSGKQCDIHPGPARGIYYRSVLVACAGKHHNSLYAYNMTEKIAMTEDRTAKEPFILDLRIAQTILQCADRSIIRECVTAEQGLYEHDLDFDWSSTPPAIDFLEVVGALARDNITSVNQTAMRAYEKHARVVGEPDAIELTDIERQQLDKALAFCRRLGFDIKYEISVVESLGPQVHGMARNGKIYLAQSTFMAGTKHVAGTLIEEHVHLKHKLADCSRAMQEYLLNGLVSLGERLTGEPL